MNGHTSLSKRLSYVLRHRPDSVGIVLDPQGWVEVATLLDALHRHGSTVTLGDLERVVEESDKLRFELDLERGRVRCRQGHSVEVDLGLESATPPALLFHGTPSRNVESIMREGLDRRRRHHVHLSGERSTATAVGARRGDAVVLEVDARAMVEAGHVFWHSTNGVWLVDVVPPAYLRTP